MQWLVSDFYDEHSAFPFQAFVRVKGAKPFAERFGKVLHYPKAERDTILLGAKTKDELRLLIEEFIKGLQTYKQLLDRDAK